MAVADRLQKLLPGDAARLLAMHADRVTQIRLRAERPVLLAGCGFEAVGDAPLSAEALRRVLAALMEYSLYARQQELDDGFFTLEDGSMVKVHLSSVEWPMQVEGQDIEDLFEGLFFAG